MTIKNEKLRRLMDKAGYQDFSLVRGEGYFYVAGDTEEAAYLLDNLYSASIYVCYFSQMEVEDWFDAVSDIIEEAKRLQGNKSFLK